MSRPRPTPSRAGPEAPRVSVAMAAYNAEATIADAVRSILWQTLGDWELLVADDGSTDGTGRIIEAFQDPRIRRLGGEANLGKPARMNQMIEAARAPLFAVMDADDISYPERLAVQAQYLHRHPDVDLMAAGMATFDEAGRVGRWRRLGVEHEEIVSSPWAGFHFNSPTWMGRTDWFDRFRYRCDLRAAEDEDLLLRAYRSSRFAGITSILLAYRIDRWSWRKALRMRRDHVRSLASESVRERNPMALGGIALHGAKLGREALAVLLRQEQRVLDARALPLSTGEEEVVRTLLRRVAQEETMELQHP